MEAIITIIFSVVIAVAILGAVALIVDIYRVESQNDKHLPLP